MATIEEVELLSAPAIPGLGASPETRGRIAREMRAMADRVEAGEVVSLEYFNGRHSSEGPAQWSVTIGL